MWFLLWVLGIAHEPYYFDRRIHNLGNVGALGRVHASVARPATWLIDTLAYDGRDVRREVLDVFVPRGNVVVDLCCGTGTSTHQNGIGVDTSPAMLSVARWHGGPSRRYVEANAETYGHEDEFDVATVFFSLHEMPAWARHRVLSNARRIASGPVIVCDIAPSYRPSTAMLRGEPYLEEYLGRIVEELEEHGAERIEEYLPGHVLLAVL